ncbi:GNAT superfamily N-acetyltransferase [Aeromicrobium panaciterrae]|uniref:GNAT superfamily N-acetyltransferase n=1 Tax=Aeromicrobium panaciterrae TaxID=363861 RepID=A0ABU1UJ84_9ACTN|nr:GNAT family N-acetyltransferase [Aeromicrobium panaciterrae]MDR7085223.1 GNAT superfamily N-acetyltransferase [Aeromicrobium panaciterrae]
MTTRLEQKVDDVLLLDGSRALVRRLRDSDRPAVTQLFASVCDQSAYTRFFTLGRAVVSRHVDHLFDRSAAVTTYVLVRDRAILGIADVEVCDPTTSEIAFLVADEAHGLGAATLLLERAARDAQHCGVETFVADVLAINHPMIDVFRDAGYRVELHSDHDEISVRMSTQDTEATRSASLARHALAESHVPTGPRSFRSRRSDPKPHRESERTVEAWKRRPGRA